MLDHISILIRAKEKSKESQIKSILRILEKYYLPVKSSLIFSNILSFALLFCPLILTFTCHYNLPFLSRHGNWCTQNSMYSMNTLNKWSMHLHAMLDILNFAITFHIYQCYLIIADHNNHLEFLLTLPWRDFGFDWEK